MPTEVSKPGVKTTGILMLLLLHGPAFDFCSSWLRFMASTLKASILFSHSLKQTWMYHFTCSSLQESTRLMFLMETDADTSYSSTRAFTASNKLDSIGLRNFAKDSSLVTSFKVKSTNASSFGRIASFLHTWMIVSYSGKIWQSWIRLFHH